MNDDKQKIQEMEYIIKHIEEFEKKQTSVCYLDSALERIKNELKDIVKEVA